MIVFIVPEHTAQEFARSTEKETRPDKALERSGLGGTGFIFKGEKVDSGIGECPVEESERCRLRDVGAADDLPAVKVGDGSCYFQYPCVCSCR